MSILALTANVPSQPKSQNGSPLVSIIITYYNQVDYIQDALQSARAQSYGNTEILVVDDGSRQDAHEFLLTVANGVRVIRQKNAGVSTARNTGIAAANGEYIVFLDGDDRLMPDAVASHLQAIAGAGKPGLVFAAIRKMNKEGRVTSAPYVCAPRRNYFRSMLEACLIQCPAAAMMSRHALLTIGGLDTNINYSEDRDLYLRLARYFPVVRHTHLVAERRMHDCNASHNRERAMRCGNYVLDKAERELNLGRAERRCTRAGRTRIAVYNSKQGTASHRMQCNYLRLRSLAQSSVRESLQESVHKVSLRVVPALARLATVELRRIPLLRERIAH